MYSAIDMTLGAKKVVIRESNKTPEEEQQYPMLNKHKAIDIYDGENSLILTLRLYVDYAYGAHAMSHALQEIELIDETRDGIQRFDPPQTDDPNLPETDPELIKDPQGNYHTSHLGKS